MSSTSPFADYERLPYTMVKMTVVMVMQTPGMMAMRTQFRQSIDDDSYEIINTRKCHLELIIVDESMLTKRASSVDVKKGWMRMAKMTVLMTTAPDTVVPADVPSALMVTGPE